MCTSEDSQNDNMNFEINLSKVMVNEKGRININNVVTGAKTTCVKNG
jgi:hypothetical protein